MQYPSKQNIAGIDKGKNLVPEVLNCFMMSLVGSKVKKLSISKCIVQTARTRIVIKPILFGLGAHLEKTFGSKWLVNHISKLKFSITADEGLQFKQSTIQNTSTGFEEQTHAT